VEWSFGVLILCIERHSSGTLGLKFLEDLAKVLEHTLFHT